MREALLFCDNLVASGRHRGQALLSPDRLRIMQTFELLRQFIDDQCLAFFLGAGASLHTAYDPTNGNTDGSKTNRLPTAVELSEKFAALLGRSLPSGSSNNLVEVASYFEILTSRFTLAERLAELFDVHYAPGKLHRFLATLPASIPILTTNYDRHVERAFDDIGRPYHLVVNTLTGGAHRQLDAVWFPPGKKAPERIKDEYQSFDEFPIIFKVHGSVGLPHPFSDSFVISEEDYYRLAGREHVGTLVPTHIAALIANRSFVFLGYRLRDIHIRHALLQTGSRQRKSFVFNRTVSDFEKLYWRLLHLEAFELDAESFVDSMSAVMGSSTPRFDQLRNRVGRFALRVFERWINLQTASPKTRSTSSKVS